MRLLADENVPLVVVAGLREAGHDVAWVRTDAPGMRDPKVLARSTGQSRVLVTFGRGFAALVFRDSLPAVSGVILLRVPLRDQEALRSLVVRALASPGEWEGHFSVVEPGRIRRTPLPPARRR